MNVMPPLFPYDAVQRAVAGSIVYPPGGRFGPRVQQDIQLVLLYAGEMSVRVDGNPLHVQPGNAVLLKPGHEESFVFSEQEETWHRWISISLSSLPQHTRDYLYNLPVCQPLSEEMNRLVDLMLAIQANVPADDPLNRNLGLAALHLYATELLRMKRQYDKHPSVYQAIAWIREHYAEEISLRDLAEQVGMTPGHLIRLFRRDEGVTPMQYVWRCRIERSQVLLAHTGLTVAEVARRCGFKDAHHFARAIKQSTGKTPSQIRKKSWGG